MGRERDESGQFNDQIQPETVLEVFKALEDTARPLTATDVANEMDIARRTAYNKLNLLVERDELETRKVGARGRVWWVPHLDGSDSGSIP
ncbi:helix-turn-helix domain-containing protein [Natronoglomus mannanivorans]|uniref:helix-turn-helix domain-containing protein n=1 Tax=Natronoglomus mannanivorans TaxID=2979990 RepID=UPI003082890D